MEKTTISFVMILLTAISYCQENSESEKENLAGRIAQESRYYGLIIGINENQDKDLQQLEFPIDDAINVFNILVDKYIFEKDNVILLQNPTRAEIIDNFDSLTLEITQDDNLFIFYSGHGQWDKVVNEGYWLPYDARQNATNSWLSYSTLEEYVRKIQSRHTLLIIDACFSGAIFKTRAAFPSKEITHKELYNMPSRRAITSSNLAVVPDDSPFANYLMMRLSDNEETFLSSGELFRSFRIDVMNSSNAIPQYGVIGSIGDQGGDFIFIHR